MAKRRFNRARRAAAPFWAAERPAGRAARRFLNVWRYRKAALRRPRQALRYLQSGQELTNFTYEISNTAELVGVVAEALGRPTSDIQVMVDEVGADEQFLAGLRSRLYERRGRPSEPRFGRRLGWYCFVRALQPAVVVETGSHDGLGTALLAKALAANAEDGAPGVLLSFDIDLGSGWLVAEALQTHVRRHIGDARATLPGALADRAVGVFIHDSLHTYEHERFELETALKHAADELVLISDNAHDSTALPDVCAEWGLRYFFFRERPLDHFYPGAGLGVGIYKRGAASESASAT